jgi:2-C-methyl-D-erythritol 4-phosphate cytidylyltransferase
MNKFVIIAAGGVGLRMKTDKLKQFIVLAGKPILMHTIQVFYNYDKSIKIILALPSDHIKNWMNLCNKFKFEIKFTVAEGGRTRFHSVKNALELVDDEGYIAIHDAVRPFVSQNTISRCFDSAILKENAVPVIDINETTRIIGENYNKSIDRRKIKLVQTPQVFKCEDIKKAYEQNYKPDFTDDASVMESCGHKINLVEGNIENIKITRPFDIIIAETLIKNRDF